MANPTEAPYATLLARTKNQFRDQPASPQYEDSEIIGAIHESLSELNAEYPTGFTIVNDTIAGTGFDPWDRIGTAVAIGAAYIMAGWEVNRVNRGNLEVKKRNLAFSINRQVEMWGLIQRALGVKFQRAKENLIYRTQRGARITIDEATETTMSTGSTIP